MTFFHFRYRDRLGLLAASALDPREADAVLEHAADCESCRVELAMLREVTAGLAKDSAIDRPLPISSDALLTRVLARIGQEASTDAPPRWRLAPVLGTFGLVGVGLLAGVLLTRFQAPAETSIADASIADASISDTSSNDAAFYERLEKTHLRANAARYLAEAQDVLIQVTAAADCPDSPKDSVDVAREAQTSRTLLKRRAALVSGSGETLIAARGVMEEVEGLLQQVADLPQCTRRTDVDAIARRVDRRNLLMKIDMVSQELAAP
jgi:hypothetical protein